MAQTLRVRMMSLLPVTSVIGSGGGGTGPARSMKAKDSEISLDI